MSTAMRFEVRLLDGIPEAEVLLQETAEAMCPGFGTVLQTGPSVLVVDVEDRPENWEFMRDLKRAALERTHRPALRIVCHPVHSR